MLIEMYLCMVTLQKVRKAQGHTPEYFQLPKVSLKFVINGKENTSLDKPIICWFLYLYSQKTNGCRMRKYDGDTASRGPLPVFSVWSAMRGCLSCSLVLALGVEHGTVGVLLPLISSFSFFLFPLVQLGFLGNQGNGKSRVFCFFRVPLCGV